MAARDPKIVGNIPYYRIEDFPSPHRTHCLSIEGWVRRTIELGRPKHVTVAEQLCRCRGNDACELVADWE